MNTLSQILSAAAAYYHGEEAMREPIDVDSLHAGRACGWSHLVQSIQEWQDLLGLDPHLAQFLWHLILGVEFVDQPNVKRLLLARPGGQIEDDRHGMALIPLGTI